MEFRQWWSDRTNQVMFGAAVSLGLLVALLVTTLGGDGETQAIAGSTTTTPPDETTSSADGTTTTSPAVTSTTQTAITTTTVTTAPASTTTRPTPPPNPPPVITDPGVSTEGMGVFVWPLFSDDGGAHSAESEGYSVTVEIDGNPANGGSGNNDPFFLSLDPQVVGYTHEATVDITVVDPNGAATSESFQVDVTHLRTVEIRDFIMATLGSENCNTVIADIAITFSGIINTEWEFATDFYFDPSPLEQGVWEGPDLEGTVSGAPTSQRVGIVAEAPGIRRSIVTTNIDESREVSFVILDEGWECWVEVNYTATVTDR